MTATMETVSLEQLCSAIELWNKTHTTTLGGMGSWDVHDLLQGMSLFAAPDTKWYPIETGGLAGSRYCKTPHGLVVQRPEPINEMSILQVETAKLLFHVCE